jgi:hypothetical protein
MRRHDGYFYRVMDLFDEMQKHPVWTQELDDEFKAAHETFTEVPDAPPDAPAGHHT